MMILKIVFLLLSTILNITLEFSKGHQKVDETSTQFCYSCGKYKQKSEVIISGLQRKEKCFFPCELRKSASEKFCKSAREHFCMSPSTFGNKFAVNRKKCPWTTVNTKKLPVNSKIARQNFQQKSARKATKTPSEHLISINFGASGQKVPVKFSKKHAR